MINMFNKLKDKLEILSRELEIFKKINQMNTLDLKNIVTEVSSTDEPQSRVHRNEISELVNKAEKYSH